MKSNIQNYNESLGKIISGVNKVCEIIKPTYGAAGGNVVIEESLRPGHRIANDGKIITDSIWLEDPVEMIGKNLLAEACEKQEREAGDGRKTTVILTAAILNEGLKYKDKIQPLELKRQLDACLPIIIKSIDDQKKNIEPTEIKSVATIAAESVEIGELIGEIYSKIGKEGIIEIDTSNLPTSFYDIVDGYRIRQGWFGGYWQTEEGKCVIKKPKILISKDKITSVDNLLPLYKALQESGSNEIFIYTEDIDLSVASRLALTSVQGGFKTLIIKAPVLWKDWYYEDISKLTGAVLVDSKIGKTFKNLSLNDLGTCETLVATKDECRLIGTKDVSDYVKTLMDSEDDQQHLRAAWLNTKVAVLKVGANSESELSWKLKKSRDGTHAAYYALRDGVVKGGGYSLDVAADQMRLETNPAGQILNNALRQPIEILGDNDPSFTLENVMDPAIVVKSAITNAISIAGIILTSKGAITIPKHIKDEMKEYAKQMPR